MDSIHHCSAGSQADRVPGWHRTAWLWTNAERGLDFDAWCSEWMNLLCIIIGCHGLGRGGKQKAGENEARADAEAKTETVSKSRKWICYLLLATLWNREISIFDLLSSHRITATAELPYSLGVGSAGHWAISLAIRRP